MGLVHFGIPQQLVLLAKERFGIRTFVETGTYRGDTAAFAAAHFDRVYTVEFDPRRFIEAKRRFGCSPHVTCLLANSPAALQQIVPELTTPTLFWLDAHWNGDGQSRQFECPVAAELAVIAQARIDCFILVDDVRYFTAPPPPPHDPSQWPSIAQLMPLLTASHRRFVAAMDDVIFAWPHFAKRDFDQFARARAATAAQSTAGRRIIYIPRDQVLLRGHGP